MWVEYLFIVAAARVTRTRLMWVEYLFIYYFKTIIIVQSNFPALTTQLACSVYVCTDGWMDGRRMDGRTNGRTDERTDGWMDGRTDGRTDDGRKTRR